MSKKMPTEVPGDTVASARAVTEYWYNVGLEVGRLDKYRSTDHLEAPTLIGLTIKCDPDDDQGVLVIARGYTEDTYVVAFHRDETVVDAVVGMSRRLMNHTAKWKEDKYANNNGN